MIFLGENHAVRRGNDSAVAVVLDPRRAPRPTERDAVDVVRLVLDRPIVLEVLDQSRAVQSSEHTVFTVLLERTLPVVVELDQSRSTDAVKTPLIVDVPNAQKPTGVVEVHSGHGEERSSDFSVVNFRKNQFFKIIS